MKKILCILLCLIFLFIVSCTQNTTYQSDTFFSMDTLAEVRIYDASVDERVFKQCKVLAEAVEEQISCREEKATVTRFNQMGEGSLPVDPTVVDLWNLSLAMYDYTEGYFSPVLGKVIDLWEIVDMIPTEEVIVKALSDCQIEAVYEENGILTKKNASTLLNFGAVGKGYCADQIAAAMKKSGVAIGMVSYVSSMVVFGDKTFKIGIRGVNGQGISGYVTLKDEALSVSGDYERFFTVGGASLPHIIDPTTGKPAQNGIHSVAVVTESGAKADAVSTALFAMGTKKAVDFYLSSDRSFDMILLTEDAVIVSDGLWDSFSSSFVGEETQLLTPMQYFERG